jgi:mono/diheme cytochrome c family protein
MIQLFSKPSPAALVAAGTVCALVLTCHLVRGASLTPPVTPTWQGPAGDDGEALKASLVEEGEMIFGRDCAECHNPDGTGQGPSLRANAKLGNATGVITRILSGSPDGAMSPFASSFTDREVAAVASYIRNSMENAFGVVREADVKPIRASLSGKKQAP